MPQPPNLHTTEINLVLEMIFSRCLQNVLFPWIVITSTLAFKM